MPKLFGSVAKLKYNEFAGTFDHAEDLTNPKPELNTNNNSNQVTNQNRDVTGILSVEGEFVAFKNMILLSGKVEVWLKILLNKINQTVLYYLREAVQNYEETQRENWIIDYPAQVAITANQIIWVSDVTTAFSRFDQGYENSMRDYQKKQMSQLNSLIMLLSTELSKSNRQKVTSICTMDVHSRDIISKLINNQVESSHDFLWQSQLKHYWNTDDNLCYVNICDAEFKYSYEYLGNQQSLVITPLTDRYR